MMDDATWKELSDRAADRNDARVLLRDRLGAPATPEVLGKLGQLLWDEAHRVMGSMLHDTPLPLGGLWEATNKLVFGGDCYDLFGRAML